MVIQRAINFDKSGKQLRSNDESAWRLNLLQFVASLPKEFGDIVSFSQSSALIEVEYASRKLIETSLKINVMKRAGYFNRYALYLGTTGWKPVYM